VWDEKKVPFAIPNPYVLSKHLSVHFPFSLEASGNVRIRIFTPSGYLIYDDTRAFASGNQLYEWDGRTTEGKPVSTGIYLYTITRGDVLVRMGKFGVIR